MKQAGHRSVQMVRPNQRGLLRAAGEQEDFRPLFAHQKTGPSAGLGSPRTHLLGTCSPADRRICVSSLGRSRAGDARRPVFLLLACCTQEDDECPAVGSVDGLKPHRVKTFKLSNDRQFAEKLEDVVSLYLHPPDNAIILSVDEKCQIQALDRTQPGLPWKKGRCGTMTHDYKRHGTTTLFAAMNTQDGSVIDVCMPTHN